jgi:RNA polymerase sigma factor (sigma-70 family)
MNYSSTEAHRNDVWFTTTRWSVVLSARQKGSPKTAEALEQLCGIYWYPLYAYVRRLGYTHHNAQDLTQAFFARLLEKDYLRVVAQEKGKFRTFLLVALKRFLADEWDRARAQKRGGGKAHSRLDTSMAETIYKEEPAPELPAERLYERRWALTLLDQAITRLRKEFADGGKAEEFEQLKGVLVAEKGAISHAALASRLGLSEGATRVAVHRFRQKFRTLFREEIAHTLSSPDELDDEVRHLMALFSE